MLQAEERSYSGGAKTGAASNALLAPDRRAATYAAFKAAPRFVLLDFRCGVLMRGKHPTSLVMKKHACSMEPFHAVLHLHDTAAQV